MRTPSRHRHARVGLVAALVLAPIASRAETADEDVWLTGDVSPLGPTIGPDRAMARAEVDWSGASGTASAGARAEVRLWRALTVFAGAAGGFAGNDARVRPNVGAAYQFLDPRHDAIGLRVQSEYKPEGLDEPEGEIETAVALSRRIGRGAVSLIAVYGQDPDAAEQDAELAIEGRAPIAAHATVGFAARGRHAIGTPKNGEPRADALAAPFAAIAIGRYQIAAACGVAAIQTIDKTTSVGVLTSLGVTVNW